MKQALITGGCGFLGRHFSKRLVSLGYHLTLVDNLSLGTHPDKWPDHLKLQPGEYDFINRDCREFFVDQSSSSSVPFDLVIHLAAVVGGREIIEWQPLQNTVNLDIDAQFFRYIARILPKKTIYMSSPVIYPISLQRDVKHKRLKEETASFVVGNFGVQDMVYGLAKYSGEFLANLVSKKYKLDILCPRPFSGYGEDQDLSYPVPAICKRAVEHQDPLEIWGSGSQVRDFIYVDDVIDNILHFSSWLGGYAFVNLGSGKANTFRDIAGLAAQMCNYIPHIVNKEDKPEGVAWRVADTTRFKTYGGKITTTLPQGISKVCDYIKKKYARK